MIDRFDLHEAYFAKSETVNVSVDFFNKLAKYKKKNDDIIDNSRYVRNLIVAYEKSLQEIFNVKKLDIILINSFDTMVSMDHKFEMKSLEKIIEKENKNTFETDSLNFKLDTKNIVRINRSGDSYEFVDGKNYKITIYIGLKYLEFCTSREMTAMILHELGHCLDLGIISIKEKIERKVILKKMKLMAKLHQIGVLMASLSFGILLKNALGYIISKVVEFIMLIAAGFTVFFLLAQGKKLKDNTIPLTYKDIKDYYIDLLNKIPEDKFEIGNKIKITSILKKIIDALLFIPKIIIGSFRLQINNMYIGFVKSMFVKNKDAQNVVLSREKFADFFAIMYGLGPDLVSVINKLRKYKNTIKESNKPYFEKLITSVDSIDMFTKSAQIKDEAVKNIIKGYEMDDYERMVGVKDSLQTILEQDDDLSNEDKKIIREQIKEIEEEMKLLKNNPAYSYYISSFNIFKHQMNINKTYTQNNKDMLNSLYKMVQERYDKKDIDKLMKVKTNLTEEEKKEVKKIASEF